MAKPCSGPTGGSWRRPEHRRILMVISDGAPVDEFHPLGECRQLSRTAFAGCHPGTSRARDAVELIAIGIGHDVTRYYRRAVTIVDAEELGGTMMRKLTELFDEDEAQIWSSIASRQSSLIA